MNYNLPSAFNRRAPSFGFGERFQEKLDRSGNIIISDVLILVDNPSPDSYRLKSGFENDPESTMSKTKAFTFGVSREAYDKVYMPS